MEVVTLKCDKCGHREVVPYDALKTRNDVHRSIHGELSIPCKCGGRCTSPYYIRGGFIIPPTIIANDKESREMLIARSVERDPTMAKYSRMMGGLLTL